MSQEEFLFWDDFCKLENNIHLYEILRAKMKNKMIYMEKNIKNFCSNSIFNDLFNISFTEKYGTINGCRLGMIWPIDTMVNLSFEFKLKFMIFIIYYFTLLYMIFTISRLLMK